MDTAGIRRTLSLAIKGDVWFSDAWHFPGMARAAEIVEKAVIVISPQEQGSERTTTEMSDPNKYWQQRVREEIVADLLAYADTIKGELDQDFKLGVCAAAERIGDGSPK